MWLHGAVEDNHAAQGKARRAPSDHPVASQEANHPRDGRRRRRQRQWQKVDGEEGQAIARRPVRLDEEGQEGRAGRG